MRHLLRGRLDSVFRGRARTVRNVLVSIDIMHMDPSLDITHTCLDVFPSSGSGRVLRGVQTGAGTVHFSLKRHVQGRIHGVPRLAFFVSSSLSCVRGVSGLLGGWGGATLGFPFCVTQHCLFSGGSRGTVGVVSVMSIYKIIITAVTLIYTLSMLGKFIKLISSVLNGFSPRLGVRPMRKGIFSPALPTIQRIGRLPRITLFYRILRSGTRIHCQSHRVATAIGNMSSAFNHLAQVSDVLISDQRNSFILSSRITGCTGLNIKATFSLKIHPGCTSPLRVCTPGEGRGIGLTGPITSLGLRCTFINNMCTAGRRVCSRGFILLPLPVIHSLFSCRGRISTVRLSLIPNTSVGSIGDHVGSLLNSSFSIGSHCRRRRTSFQVVRKRG